MSDPLLGCLRNLKRTEKSSRATRQIIELLIKIFKNVKLNPENERFRRIKTGNGSFQPVWNNPDAKRFLISSGWTEADGAIVLPRDVDIALPMSLLEDNRLVSPSEDEWTEHNKFQDDNRHEQEDERKKAALAEQKRLVEEMKKEKLKRKRINDQIKAEHRADQERRVMKDAKAQPLPSRKSETVRINSSGG